MKAEQLDTPIWKNRNFISLWIGTVFSAVGDASIFILLSWFVVDVTNSEGILGTALLCMSLPRLFFMLVGGVIADRFNRKYVLAASVLARAIVLGLFSLFLMQGVGEWLTTGVYIMSVIFGIVDSFFWPARSSIVPQVIAKEKLAAANSIMETSQQLSMIVGPLFASFLLFSKNYPLMFFSISIVFLMSMVAILAMKMGIQTDSDTHTEETNAKSSMLQDTLAGIRYAKSIRSIVIILFLALFINLMFMGPLHIGLPVLIKKLGWEGSTFGFLQGAVGVGAIAGALITGLAKGFRGYYVYLAAFIGILGLSISALGLMTALPFGLAAMFIAGFCISCTNIPIFTFIQTVVEDRMLGRVMSLLTMMASGLGPVSYALAAFILEKGVATPAQLLLGGGLCLAIIGFACFLIRDFRRMEQHPAWQQSNKGLTETKQPVAL
ncbi:MFS transporter [Brevibacillus sp. SYSU BS000544]|uniref:MFS transporter n=1 Tax=Brevibacillus sp. SYSU BS000544 TaxID=3416443 RepID=UPI003CE579E7